MTRPRPLRQKAFSGVLRRARAEDLDDIVKVENECFGTERYSRELLDDYLQASLDVPRRVPMIVAFGRAAAKERPRVAGYALGEIGQDGRGLIVNIAVGKDFRGRHLGRELLDRVSESLLKAGASDLVLEVETTNAVALRLYETAGFVKDRVLKNYYGQKRDAHLMVKRPPKGGARRP